MNKTCDKVDLRKVNLKKSATWNIYKQFGLDLDNYKGKVLDVDTFRMPRKEQDKLLNYLLDHTKKLTHYKGYRMPKKWVENHILFEYLCYFPRGNPNE